MITGLFETHLNVRDLERASQFYGALMGLEFAHREEARRVAFYWMGGRGESMLGLWEKPADQVVPQHFAFRSTVDWILSSSVAWLAERGLHAFNFLHDASGQPMVFGWMPAVSIYFLDPDGHILEFISMIDAPPRPDLGVVSWQRWQEATGT